MLRRGFALRQRMTDRLHEPGQVIAGSSITHSDAAEPLFFSGDLHRRGACLSTWTSRAGLGLAAIRAAAETGAAEERDLRMRDGIDRRIADPVSVPVLSLLHYFPDLRCGSHFPGAVRGCLHRAAIRCLHCDPGIPPPAFGGTDLGLE